MGNVRRREAYSRKDKIPIFRSTRKARSWLSEAAISKAAGLPDPNPSCAPRSRHSAAASAQTACVNRVSKPQVRDILGLVRWNFCSFSSLGESP